MTIAEFKDTVTTADQLREVLGQPSAMVEAKVISALDVHWPQPDPGYRGSASPADSSESSGPAPSGNRALCQG